jgi:hypothetical protein
LVYYYENGPEMFCSGRLQGIEKTKKKGPIEIT